MSEPPTEKYLSDQVQKPATNLNNSRSLLLFMRALAINQKKLSARIAVLEKESEIERQFEKINLESIDNEDNEDNEGVINRKMYVTADY